MILEICTDSVEGALAAQTGGAQRIELCAALLEGGITPSAGMIAQVRSAISIGLHVIIRPRGGDFCYSAAEFDVMKEDIRQAKALGADGVVFGILRPDGTVDLDRNAELIALTRPLRVTFHRAFDVTRDPQEALNDLIDLGVERVLTSGQEDSALAGLALITELVQLAGDRIIVMPGGGINARNVAKIMAESGAREVHLSARSVVPSAMQFRRDYVHMGGALYPPEYSRAITDAERVRAIVDML